MSNLKNIPDSQLSLEIDKLDMQLVVAEYAYQNAWSTEMTRDERDALWDEIATLRQRRVALANEWLRRYREQNSR